MPREPYIRHPTPKHRRVLLAQIWWEDRVLRGVATQAAAHGWDLDCRMRWTHRLPTPAQWRGDGIIVNTGASAWLKPAARPLIRFVREAQVPVVDMQELGDYFGAPKVFVAHAALGRMAAEHFIGLDFQRIGFVTFEENPLEATRREEFRAVVEAAGRRFEAFAWRTFPSALRTLAGPIALATVNDVNALQLIRHCLDAGRGVPEEIAVLGCDDTEILCDLAPVGLSSVNCDYERLGRDAAEVLQALMEGGVVGERRREVPPRGVVARRSSDTVAMADPQAARLLRMLRDRHAVPINLTQVAAELGVPGRSARTEFRRRLGCTPTQELTRLRVESAKQALTDRRKKLDEVARECGFTNRFHFTRAFKRVTGLSPRAYRVRSCAQTE